MSKEKEVVENTEVAEVKKEESLSTTLTNPIVSTMPVFFDKSSQALAMNLSKSDLIPQSYVGKPMNVLIALDQAQRMGVSPMFVMEEMAIIRGKRSWSGKACLQLIRTSPKFENVEIKWVGEPHTDSWGAYVSAIDKRTGKEIKGATVTVDIAKKEGWWSSNKKWSSLTELMLQYRAGAFFCRVHCPEQMNGYVEGEIEDIEGSKVGNVDNPFASAMEDDGK